MSDRPLEGQCAASRSPPCSPRAPQREGVVAVIEQRDTYLVIRRSEHVVAPGKLCFPGGGIEVGESQEDALRRELSEELGIEITPGAKLWESVTRTKTRIHWWSASVSTGARLDPNPQEVSAIYWMTKQELLARADLLDGNRSFLDRA